MDRAMVSLDGMIRTQVRLTEQQISRLRQAARAQDVSIAEIIRRVVDRGIVEELTNRKLAFERAARQIGHFRDSRGASDVSTRHDAHLDEGFA